MREIKFKYGFTNHDEVVLTLAEIENGEELHNIIYKCDGGRVKYRRQYTGIKDANGAEIYFGDVVPIAGYGDLHVKDVHDIPTLIDAIAEGDMGAIKGNIHANPELLEAS